MRINSDQKQMDANVPGPAEPPATDHDETARLAYMYWEERGGENGSADDDWFRAEGELRRRTQPAKAPARLQSQLTKTGAARVQPGRAGPTLARIAAPRTFVC